MSLIFSRHCEYALQALLVLAANKQDQWISLKNITDKLNAPEQYMAKILQDMARKGFLESRKGPFGGFKMKKPAHKIILYDVVSAIDGTEFLDKCVLGFSECSNENPCPKHKTWEKILADIRQTLFDSSIEEMAKKNRKFDSVD